MYRRQGAYFVGSWAVTTDGLSVMDGDPRRLDGADAEPGVLGAEVLARLAQPQRVVPHPRREEWPERRRRSLAPFQRLAGVRSWRAFVSVASLVEVERGADGVVTVMPMRPMPKPIGAFEGDGDRAVRLPTPSAEQLGNAVLRAFAVTPGSGPAGTSR